jgi:hypothetical protein
MECVLSLEFQKTGQRSPSRPEMHCDSQIPFAKHEHPLLGCGCGIARFMISLRRHYWMFQFAHLRETEMRPRFPEMLFDEGIPRNKGARIQR